MSIAIAPRPATQPPARRLTTAARGVLTTVPPSVLASFVVVLIVLRKRCPQRHTMTAVTVPRSRETADLTRPS
jgi:hypothetical protein